MEKSEPALVPQWLRASNGGVTGRSNPNNVGSSPSADRTSSYHRSVSSNGLGIGKDIYPQSRHYSNFSRNHRNREPKKDAGYHENERPLRVENGHHDHPKSPKGDRIDKSMPWQSKYMINSRDPNLRTNLPGNKTGDGSPTGIFGGSVLKTSFEREFPSLLPDERQGDVIRTSPRFTSAAHVGSSVISSDIWTSALVDIPPTVGGNVPMPLTAQQSAPSSMLSVPITASTGLNMAETLAKAPLRPQCAPQFAVETLKLEELAIRQSKQLIPMTPSILKPMVTNLAEKSKTKPRMGEMGVSLKSAMQPSSLPVNNSRGIAKSELSKPSQVGNLQVLNREKNGFSSAVKDVANSNPCKTSDLSVPSAMASTKNSSHLKVKMDGKANLWSGLPNNLAERKAALQAKDRNEFFNSLRKTSANSTAKMVQLPLSSSVVKNLGEQGSAAVSDTTPPEDSCFLPDPGLGSPGLDGSANNENPDASGFELGERDAADIVDLTEEEKRFLISLGWEENMGCKPLTAEEIDAFLKKHNLISSKVSE